MTYEFQAFPSVRYGPGGQTITVNHEEEVPEGFVDHPSKLPKKEQKAHGVGVTVPGGPASFPGADVGSVAADHTRGGNDQINRGGPQSHEQGGGTVGGELGQPTDNTNIFTVPPIDDITNKQIIAQLNSRKVVHNPNWRKEKLYQLLVDSVGSTSQG